METVSPISIEEAHEILSSHNLIAIGARADEERRRRHGLRTTFVRVCEIHGDAIPSARPSTLNAGEVRLVGPLASTETAIESVHRVLALAGEIPVTAFSFVHLWELAKASPGNLERVLENLKSAGLETISDAPIDVLPDPVRLIRLARQAGIAVSRLTVHQLSAQRRVEIVELAAQIQAEAGGIRAFAPLPRTSAVAQPSTGYDDVKQIAIARLLADNIDSIQVDWSLYGPKLAQVALTMGADDVDSVSPLEGNLGRRRSPLEEIRRNIIAAGQEPVERDGAFRVLRS